MPLILVAADSHRFAPQRGIQHHFHRCIEIIQIAVQYYSVHGLPVKIQVLLVKFVPHRFVMNIWLNQQKTAKNNRGLTVEGRK